MIETVSVLKDEENQTPIPSAWRGTFRLIVEAFKEGDFKLERGVIGVRNISSEDASRIEKNIERYGTTLTSLPEETWGTSVCQWMRSYWDVLIDLYTVEEGASDLVLAVRVYEEGKTYIFEVQSVYVP
jgi:hypothetical protein